MARSKSSQKSAPRWRQFLLQPPLIAGALSVGFHGALFAAGPTLSDLSLTALATPDLAQEARNVPLVELTAEEQARLPDFSSSFYSLTPTDPFTNPGDSFTNIEPVPGEPPIGSLSLSDLLSPSQPLGGTGSDRLPLDLTPYQPRRPVVVTEPGSVRPEANRPTSSAPTAQGGSPQPNAPTNPPGSNGTASPPGSNGAGAPPVTSEPSAEDLVMPPASSGNGGQNPSQVAAGGRPTTTPSLAEQVRAYGYNAERVSDAASAEAVTAWLEAGKRISGLSELPLEEPIKLPVIEYGRQICLPRAPQKGLIGAFVSPEGKLAEDPWVLKSTGYPFLNQQALTFVKTLDFSSVNQFKAYQFEVSVNYDAEICIDLGQVSGEN